MIFQILGALDGGKGDTSIEIHDVIKVGDFRSHPSIGHRRTFQNNMGRSEIT